MTTIARVAVNAAYTAAIADTAHAAYSVFVKATEVAAAAKTAYAKAAAVASKAHSISADTAEIFAKAQAAYAEAALDIAKEGYMNETEHQQLLEKVKAARAARKAAHAALNAPFTKADVAAAFAAARKIVEAEIAEIEAAKALETEAAHHQSTTPAPKAKG